MNKVFLLDKLGREFPQNIYCKDRNKVSGFTIELSENYF